MILLEFSHYLVLDYTVHTVILYELSFFLNHQVNV